MATTKKSKYTIICEDDVAPQQYLKKHELLLSCDIFNQYDFSI